jgi:amidase
VLEKVLHVLLRTQQASSNPIKNIYLLDNAFAIADLEIQEALQENIAHLKQMKDIKVSSITLSDIVGEKMDLFSCNEKALRVLQSAEIWNALGSWIETFRPEVGPRVSFGLQNLRQMDRSQLNNALYLCEKLFTKISQFTKAGDLFCFPTMPIIAPIKGELDIPEKAMDYYNRTMSITSFAGVARLPEITIPAAKIGNIPVGLSFTAASHQDEFLISAAKQLFNDLI